MNARQKSIEHLAGAANHMRQAVEELQAIKDDAEMRRLIGPDAAYYRVEIETLLSCDNGEAGLNQLIDLLVRRWTE